MIKEILRGNNIPLKEEIRSKKKSIVIKPINKKINSVLNNFVKFNKINLRKRTNKNLIETNSMKIMLNKKFPSQKKISGLNKNKNSSLINSEFFSNNNIKNNNSYNFRNDEITREISLYINSFNEEEKKNSNNNNSEKKYLKTNEKCNLKNTKNDEIENGNESQKKHNIYLSNNEIDNRKFINNLEKEFQLKNLKKKLKTLKNINIVLIQKLNNIIEKNKKLKIDTKEEQNKRKKIICSTIDICNNNFIKNDYGVESRFKNLLLNLMNLKYNYENSVLENDFISNIGQLFILSNIYQGKNENNNQNSINNIYNNVKNLFSLKDKYINDIKEYNISKIENKKYYNYFKYLSKNLNINNIDNIYKYIKNIKISNDNEIRKMTKMKHVLFDDNKSKKRRNNINSSVDLNIPRKKSFNYNYEDLQNYFIEKNKRDNYRKHYSAKTSNMTIKIEKNRNFSGIITDKENYNNNENNLYCNNTTKNENKKINYYDKKRGEILNHSHQFNVRENNFKILKELKNNNINKEKENENENEKNDLYYSYNHNIRSIPYNNNRIFNKIEIKKYRKINKNSKTNLTGINENIYKKNNTNRINSYKINLLNNKLNNTINIKLIGVSEIFNKSQRPNKSNSKNENNSQLLYKNENNNNFIKRMTIKKKPINLNRQTLIKVKENNNNIDYNKNNF